MPASVHAWACPNGHRYEVESKGPGEHRTDAELMNLDRVVRVLGRGCSICGQAVRYVPDSEVKHGG
jgi:hypothetical protein